MKSTSTAPFQSPSGDFDPALLLLNLRNKDDGDSSDELRRASSQASSGPVSHATTEHDDLAGTSFTRESSFASSDTCTCKKSRCLKKYCQCFASNAVCNQHCRCIECENTSFDNPPRKRAIEELLIRNPTAFVPKIKVDTAITVDEDVIQQTSHRVGCRCRKSMCLKKYCECYQGGVLCTTICTCLDCRNKGDGSGLDDAMLTNDGQMDMEVSLVKAKIIKKQTSFTKKRPLSFLEEESPVCANYDTAKFFPEDGAMPAFAAALHSAANGPLSMATSGAVGNPTSLLSANLMKHALSSSSSSSSSGPTASSSTLTRNNTFPVRPSQLTAADHHHEQDMKRMKSLSAFEAASSAYPSSSSHMQHSTPIANKTPLSSSSSSQSRTTRATSNSLETPRNNPNISPQSWSIAQAFYRLGDEFAAKQQRNGSSLLLTDEQRKAIRLSMSSSISTEGREAIAESVLRTLRFSAENFFQQFSETTPEAAQAEKVAIADNNNHSSSNDPTTRRASAYTAAAAGSSSSSSTRSILMDVDEIDDTSAAAATAAATAPVAPSTQKKQKVSTANHHHNSLPEEEEESTTEQRARALSEASAKENTDPSSVTQTASAMREIQVTDYKASPFAGKHPHHQSKRLVHRKGSRTTTTATTAMTHEQHQNKRRRRNSIGSRHSAHDDSETEAEDDDNLSDDGERLRRRADSMNDDDDKNDNDDNDDDASTEDERDNDFDGEGEDRERRYLKKMAAKQRAVQAALDAAAMTMPPVAVSE